MGSLMILSALGVPVAVIRTHPEPLPLTLQRKHGQPDLERGDAIGQNRRIAEKGRLSRQRRDGLAILEEALRLQYVGAPIGDL